MAKSPEVVTIEAELLLRYPNGKESKLGAVLIESDVRYEYSFEKAADQDAPATIKDSLRRVQGEAL